MGKSLDVHYPSIPICKVVGLATYLYIFVSRLKFTFFLSIRITFLFNRLLMREKCGFKEFLTKQT